jgi:predicted nucleotidyltransferase
VIFVSRDNALRIAREFAGRVRAELDANASVFLFGSAARGEMGEHSDVDVAVVSSLFGADVCDNYAKVAVIAHAVSWDIEPHAVLNEDMIYKTPFTVEIQREGLAL